MSMSHRAWIAFAFFSIALKTSAAADPPQSLDEAPEIAFVSATQGQLRSGPGEDFYPTSRIERNASLEVYHQTADGWLGVRPPEGSFSWVKAADAYLLPGGRMIEVTGTSAVSWIGTSLGSAKQYRWQVKLRPGEQLGVIGEQTTQQADGKEILWYKIAPPAGEFRWIDARAVSSQPVNAPAVATNQAIAKTRRQPSTSPNAPVVTMAAYQAVPGEVTEAYDSSNNSPEILGSSSAPIIVGGSYPRAPLPGEIVNGEVVVGNEYAPGQVIESHDVPGQGGDGDYAGNETIDGQYADGPYFDGEAIEGEVVSDGSYYEDGSDDVIYDGGDYVDGVIKTGSNKLFDGWHAIDLNDDGMRLTWLERLYGRAKQQGPDPLQADPFSLAMQRGQVRPNSPRAVEQMYPQGIPQREFAATSPANSRHRPWRDPRTLGKNRFSGNGSPLSAPELSSLERMDAAQRLESDHPTPLTDGIQRLSDALHGGKETLLTSQTTAEDNTSVNVNWYGVGQTSGVQGENNAIPANPATTAANTNATQTVAATEFGLNQLQLNLSEAVTQPMQMWSLQPIYDSTKYYVEHGASAIERGQARLLLERIEEFADLAARSGYLALNRQNNGPRETSPPNAYGSSPTASVMLASTSSSPLGNVVRSDFERALGGGSSYDATGWLVPVIAASSGQPSHALTDDTGRIQAYLSPVPGLNLDRYVNQAVGVTGLRGYLPQLQAGHIQASRVVRIQ